MRAARRPQRLRGPRRRPRSAALEAAFGRGATLLDRHTDADHDRTVFTLAGEPGPLAEALVAGAEEAIETIDMAAYAGLTRRSARSTSARSSGSTPPTATPPGPRRSPSPRRSAARRPGLPLRRAGARARPGRARLLPQRRPAGALAADGGRRAAPGLRAPACRTDAPAPPWSPPARRWPPSTSSSTAATSRIARAVAAELRESGGGLPGVRAIGLLLSSGRAQVSTNVHDPLAVPLGAVVERVRELPAPLGARPLEAELVGLIPAAALAGYPEDVPIRGFDPERHVIERRLAGLPLKRATARFSAMAQTKKKRRRKHRGTQGGRIDTSRRRASPRSREEAKARARANRSNRQPRADPPPTWRTAIIRGVVAAVIFFVLLLLIFKRPLGAALGFGAFMLVFYIPAGYYIDMTMWRRRERARMRKRQQSQGGG